MTIQLTTDGTTLTATGSPTIICDNADYSVEITGATSLTEPKLLLTAEQDGVNTEYELTLTGGACDLPAISNAWGVWAAVEHAGGRTERLWLPCGESIKGGHTTAYSAPYDVYNAACEYANAALTGSATEEELAAMMAALTYRAQNPEPYPGTAYKRAITASVREDRLTGKITLTDSSEIDLTDESIVESTLSISTAATGSDYLLPGGVPSKELAVTLRGSFPDELLRGAEIAPKYKLRLESGHWQEIDLGVFTIMSAGDDTARGIPITAYDDMRRLDTITPAEFGFAAKTGYSPNQIIKAICEEAEIDYTENVDFDNRFTGNNTHTSIVAVVGNPEIDDDPWAVIVQNADDITDVQAYLDEHYAGQLTYAGDVDYWTDLPSTPAEWTAYKLAYNGPRYIVAAIGGAVETARDLLMHTVFTVGGFAEITVDRKMHIEPIAQAHDAETVGENRTHRRAVSRLEYKLSSLTMPITYAATGGTQNTVMHTEETIWSEKYVEINTSENALWPHIIYDTGPWQYVAIQTQMNHLTDYLDPVTFHPGRIDMRGDPTIGLLDWVTTDGTRMMPVTASTWRYRGQQQLTACGSDAVAKAATSQLDKRITGDKIDQAQTTQNMMREIYGELMQTYQGMQSFQYTDIQHYTYNELGGGIIT